MVEGIAFFYSIRMSLSSTFDMTLDNAERAHRHGEGVMPSTSVSRHSDANI